MRSHAGHARRPHQKVGVRVATQHGRRPPSLTRGNKHTSPPQTPPPASMIPAAASRKAPQSTADPSAARIPIQSHPAPCCTTIVARHWTSASRVPAASHYCLRVRVCVCALCPLAPPPCQAPSDPPPPPLKFYTPHTRLCAAPSTPPSRKALAVFSTSPRSPF